MSVDVKLTFTFELTRYPENDESLEPEVLADVGIDWLREEFEFDPQQFIENHINITVLKD